MGVVLRGRPPRRYKMETVCYSSLVLKWCREYNMSGSASKRESDGTQRFRLEAIGDDDDTRYRTEVHVREVGYSGHSCSLCGFALEIYYFKHLYHAGTSAFAVATIVPEEVTRCRSRSSSVCPCACNVACYGTPVKELNVFY